jgi:hypothetical protein
MSDVQVNQENLILQKKYWSGNIRLLSDSIWCLLIALLIFWSNHQQDSTRDETRILPTSTKIHSYVEATSDQADYLKPQSSGEKICDDISSFFGSVIGCFFMFFFWSWNQEHLRCLFAKVVIHIFCGIFFAISLATLVFLAFYFPNSLNEYTGWYMLILTFISIFFISRKYKSIMWPSKKRIFQ